ncbi:MAG: undecaprenyldiphospho-muramoylpentapeptide beta-N-acetylglucosaminyltransferase [Ruminococcaceae bacterium]|nr:undecaprenyldiphospho-muramoylpentapeptide beta-N-acetylglucosaminyltransferase [Oscillospiraceae bacterium]
MKVLLTGGGTSGHVTPALAIADIIKEREPSSVFAYVGTENGIEKKLVEKEFYEFHPIEIQGIRRKLSLSNIKTAYLIMRAPSRAKKIIEKFKPDVVIGTGGYVCWAPLKAAAEMGIPTVIHESNSVPGLAVRKLEGQVDLILTNFKSTSNSLKEKKKVVNVGNPIRSNFGECSKADARARLGIDADKFLILSFGGSLGAPALNEAAIDVMKDFAKDKDDVICVHSGGKNYYKNAMELFVAHGLERNSRLEVKEYIYDMGDYMTAADVVICRAGAMTLTELAKMHKPAILIPSPNVANNHQYKNAQAYAKAGAAVLIEESDLDSQRIVMEMEKIYSDTALREKMGDAIAKFAYDDVDERIYEEISKLVKNRSKIKKKGR